MILLSLTSWVDGITATAVVLFGFIFGVFFFYQSRKKEAKILLYLSLAIIFAGLMFLGVFLDFISVLVTQDNLNNINGFVGILSYIWYAPTILSAIYIGGILIVPNNKWIPFIIFGLISIAFEIVIFLTPFTSFNFKYPLNTGESLIDYNINPVSLAGILMAGLLFPIFVFLTSGFLYRSTKSTGILRKKFLYLAIGVVNFSLFGLFEGLFELGLWVIIVRLGYLSSFWFMYFGLK